MILTLEEAQSRLGHGERLYARLRADTWVFLGLEGEHHEELLYGGSVGKLTGIGREGRENYCRAVMDYSATTGQIETAFNPGLLDIITEDELPKAGIS